MITLWIDGDACPKAVKEILFRAAIRTKTNCILVANHFIPLPKSPFIQLKQVDKGFDKADDLIANHVNKRDIVITSDLPLADTCLSKNAFVISPRGEQYRRDTMKQKLAMRDFNEVMRGSGIHSKGPSALSAKDINQFANQLDRLLSMNRPKR